MYFPYDMKLLTWGLFLLFLYERKHMALIRPIKDKLRLKTHSAASLSSKNMQFYVHTNNFWTFTCMWPGPQPIPIPGISSMTNSRVKIFSVMYKERSKSARKCSKTGCTTYRPDLSFSRTVLIVYFVTSKFGLLNENGFSLINFISLNTNFKLLNI